MGTWVWDALETQDFYTLLTHAARGLRDLKMPDRPVVQSTSPHLPHGDPHLTCGAVPTSHTHTVLLQGSQEPRAADKLGSLGLNESQTHPHYWPQGCGREKGCTFPSQGEGPAPPTPPQTLEDPARPSGFQTGVHMALWLWVLLGPTVVS